jgi:hypothetical protein
MGIEPTYAAWEAAVLPLNYVRRARALPHVTVDGNTYATAQLARGGLVYRLLLKGHIR